MDDNLADLLTGPVLTAARGLLGRRLFSNVADELTAIAITEVEAYGGADDPASHAYRGMTRRNRSMFGPPGTLYVYRSYGVHWCVNAATGPDGVGSAVLLRGGRPIEGVATMKRRRGRDDHLTDGPGKLAQALGITGDHDGTSWMTGPVRIGEVILTGRVEATSRVGITRAADRPWRLVLDAPRTEP